MEDKYEVRSGSGPTCGNQEVCELVDEMLGLDIDILKKVEYEALTNDNSDCDILCRIVVPKSISELEQELIFLEEEVLKIRKEIYFLKYVK